MQKYLKGKPRESFGTPPASLVGGQGSFGGYGNEGGQGQPGAGTQPGGNQQNGQPNRDQGTPGNGRR